MELKIIVWTVVFLSCGLCIAANSYKCSFETNTCPFLTNDPTNTVSWQIGAGKVNATYMVPSVDHTFGNSTGKYIFVNVSAVKTKPVILLGPEMKQDYCINFWYHMFGAHVGSLSVVVRYKQREDAYFYRESSQGNRWKQAIFSVKYDKNNMRSSFRLGFVVKNPSSQRLAGDIALDDLEFRTNTCPDTTVIAKKLCTFDYGPCGFKAIQEGKTFKWQLQGENANSVTSWNVPLVDNTLGTSKGGFWFAHIENTNGLEKAILSSPAYTGSKAGKKQCLHFYYYMNADAQSWWFGSVGDAILEVQLNNDKNEGSRVWMKAKNNTRHGIWAYGEAQIETRENFVISFAAYLKTTISASIAIDDVYLTNGQCPETGSCDFEENKCSWTDGESDLVWFRKDGISGSKNTNGPARDMTTHSSGGYYVFINMAEKKPGLKARLESDLFFPTTKPICMVFWYYMKGDENLGELKVLRKLENINETAIWRLNGHQFDGWKRAEAPAQPSIILSSQFIFEGITGKGEKGYIALDDIAVTLGENCSIKPEYADQLPTTEPPVVVSEMPQKGQVCDFEAADTCGYKTDSLDGISWRRVLAKETKVGPETDKTYNTENGHYMLVVPSIAARQSSDNQALLIIPNLPSTGEESSCLRFWYQIAGEDVISLNVHVRLPGGKLPKYSLWTRATKNGKRWLISQLKIIARYTHEVVFQAITKRGNKGYIALDDVVVEEGACQPPGSCNFEKDMCTWTNAENVDIQWVRNTGPSVNNKTGPEVDYTLGNNRGSYAYLAADNPAGKRNLIGILESEFFSTLSLRCLSFWAHMYGAEMGSLSVNVSYNDENNEKTLIRTLWKTEKDKGKKWFNRLLSITENDIYEEYQISFIGKTKGTLSDIALDDIEMTNQVCDEISYQVFDCKDGSHVIRNRVCDFEVDCMRGEDEANCGSCDFEHGDCGWADTSTSFYNSKWSRRKGKEGSSTYGPGYDHTFNSSTGFFMVFEASAYNSHESILQSAEGDNQFKKSYASCVMKFYYYIPKEPNTKLQVRKRLGSFTTGSVWEQVESKSDGWKLGTVYLSTTERPFYIDFIHQSPYSYVTTYTAIDDISFENCSKPANQESCQNSSEFTCQNQRCIPSKYLCDLTDDCGDGSDESRSICMYYPKPCTFDTDDCGWQTKGKRNNWSIKSSASSRVNSNSGPLVDHTKGLDAKEGKYLYLKKVNSTMTYNSSYYFSPNYKIPISQSCDLRFYYYMHGTENATLKIHSEFEKYGWSWTELWSRKGSFGQRWNRKIVSVRDRKPFHFIIEGILEDKEAILAIDDLSLTYGCVPYDKDDLPTPMPTELPTASTLCPAGQVKCMSGKPQCIDIAKKCDFYPDCLDGSDEAKCGTCDFDNDSNPTCGWSDLKLNRWVRQKGSRDTRGPNSDVSGTGYFMYVSSKKDGFVSNEAILKSVQFQEASSNCEISFFYYVTGLKNSDAALRLLLQMSNGASITLWTEKDDQGRQWRKAIASYGHRVNNWRLEFVATHIPKKGNINNDEVDIALDNIELSNCAPVENLKCQKESDFSCGSGKCIDALLVCDFKPDCADGSDEKNCTAYKERCDFENGDLCTWTQDERYSSKWEIKSGREIEKNNGPEIDHTIGDDTGHFLFLPVKRIWILDLPTLYSTSFKGDTSGNCALRFWYHMIDISNIKIDVGIVDAGDTRKTLIQTINGTVADEWVRIAMPLKNEAKFQVWLQGKLTEARKGEIAIDDVSFTKECTPIYVIVTTPIPTVGPSEKCALNGMFECDDNSCIPMSEVCDLKFDCPYGADERQCPARCTFEDGSMCGWTTSTTEEDDANFKVVVAETAQNEYSYLPATDKTTETKTGRYLLVHQDVAREVGPIDTFTSPNFTAAASTCKFEFWFSASNRESEKPVVILNYDGTVDVEMFRLSETHSTWVKVSMGLGRRTSNFTVRFSKPGKNEKKDYFALDDIEFTYCDLPFPRQKSCNAYFSCTINKACIDLNKVCDLTDDCGDRSDEQNCEGQKYIMTDFETNYGFFDPIVGNGRDPLSWERVSGSTVGHVEKNLGPPFDHTSSSSNGYYMAFTSGGHNNIEKTAWLASEVLEGNEDCRMRFHYYMYGSQVNTFRISTRSKIGGKLAEKWKKGGEFGNFWVRDEIELSDTEPFEVILEGIAGAGPNDVIAVDDVSFTPGCKYVRGNTLSPETTGSTPTTPTISPGFCASGEFFCQKDNKCISQEKVCDFRKDCSDGEDEEKCVKPECHFDDKDLCGWGVETQLKSPARRKRDTNDATFKWVAIRADDDGATQLNRDYRPKRDHTHNSTIGWYLLADGAQGRDGDATSLISPEISITHAKCALDFWLYCEKWFCDLKCVAEELEDGKTKSNTTLWKIGDQIFSLLSSPNEWKHVKVHLSSLKNYRIRLDTTRPFSYEGVLGLDDIVFDTCAPPVKINSSAIKCGVTEFPCKNSRCIERSYICDYSDDCMDNTDEAQTLCESYVAKCTFEHDTCPNWRTQSVHDERSIAKWQVQNTQNEMGTNPETDHTTRKAGGKYLSVSSTTLKPLFYSDALKGGKKNCVLRIWYNIIGVGHSLNVYKRFRYDNYDFTLLKTLNESVQDYWHNDQIDLSGASEDFQVVFAPTFSLYAGTINIDDLSLTPECDITGKDVPGVLPTEAPFVNCGSQKFPCKNGKCFSRVQRCNFVDDCGDFTDERDCGTSCDFEKDQCGWYSPQGYRGIWQRKAGVFSFNSPLTKDHTSGSQTGYYMTPMTTRGTFKAGDLSQMQTQPYLASGPDCKMIMWYYLSGENAGNLSVVLILPTPDQSVFASWKMIGNQGTEWKEWTIDIKKQEHFAIGIQASYGDSYKCYMAVDDIKFDNCKAEFPAVECSADEFTCTNFPQCIEGWRKCDHHPDCKDRTDEDNCKEQYGDCSFNNDEWLRKCQWSRKEYNFQWSIAAKSHSSKTGPDKGHTEGGKYLFINSSEQSVGDKAGVYTPLFKATQGKCHLRFWYYMKGSDGMGKLEVYSEGVDKKENRLWLESGPQGPIWMAGHVAITSLQDYYILFVGYVGSDKFTDIAIDDVSFTSNCKEGGEVVVPTGIPDICLADYFNCQSGKVKCVLKIEKCNCREDCEDGSDEFGCTDTCTTTERPFITGTAEYTTTGTPIPQKHCKDGWKLCKNESGCIPGLYLCDGVRDCPDNSDETYGCPAIICEGESYFCQDRSDPPCIKRKQVCDGKPDCSDGSDESLCEGECPPDFCQNKGSCSILEKVPVCECPKEYAQNRCSKKILKPEIENHIAYSASRGAWIPGVVIGTMLLIAIVFTVWYKKNTNFERQQMPHAVENPTYGLNLENLDFNQINAHHSRDFEDQPTAIENPLYAMKSED